MLSCPKTSLVVSFFSRHQPIHPGNCGGVALNLFRLGQLAAENRSVPSHLFYDGQQLDRKGDFFRGPAVLGLPHLPKIF